MADTDALLYLPGRDLAKLRAAPRIPALSPGWQGSFRDLLAAPMRRRSARRGRRGRPAWAGFRPLRVTKVVPESRDRLLDLPDRPDESPLPAARAGQYLTLRVTGAGQPAPVRSYSLSSAPGAGTYRISVKHEPHGAASRYLNGTLRPGATLDVAAPRGDFVLDDGTGPVLLISAGIGVTPVLAMLHELAAARSDREVWWIHGARGPQGTSAGRRGARPARLAAARPRARVLQRDHRRTPPRPRRAGLLADLAGLAVPARERLHLRAGLVHDRHAGRPDRGRR